MKMNKFRVQAGLGVVIVLGALALLNACGGSSGAPVSPPPQSEPNTPQVEPLTPAQTQSVTPPAEQPATPPAAQPPPATSIGTEIPVLIKDNESFDARVKAGTKVVFVITNTTRDMHTFEAPDFNLYKEIQPGETARLEWTVSDRKGSWDLGCFLTTPGGVHDGMDRGILIIE